MEDARRVGARLEAEAPRYTAAIRQLGQGASRPEAWTAGFERLTGLDAALLMPALTREVRVDALLAEGRLAGDPMAPGAVAAVFERGVDPAGVILNGPRGPRPLLYLAPGAYRVWFTLRGRPAAAGQPSAVLRVFAERRLLATRVVRADELGDGRRAVGLSGGRSPSRGRRRRWRSRSRRRGGGAFAVDRLRIEPDLPETFRERWRAVQTLRRLTPRPRRR